MSQARFGCAIVSLYILLRMPVLGPTVLRFLPLPPSAGGPMVRKQRGARAREIGLRFRNMKRQKDYRVRHQAHNEVRISS